MVVSIHWESDGRKIGDVAEFDTFRYSSQTASADGVVLAGEILAFADLKRLSLTGTERIYAQMTPDPHHMIAD